MKFTVLGPLTLHDQGPGSHPVPSAPKTRNLLALLLLRANAPVSQSACIEELWYPEIPRTAVASIHTRVLHIRQALAKLPSVGSMQAAKKILITHSRGYTLGLGPGSLDLDDLQGHLAAVRRAEPAGDDRALARSLRLALDLWKGPVLGDTRSGPLLQPHIVSLEEQRLTLLEKRIECEMRLGLHRELLHELCSLIAQYPTHENFHAQYVLALYRSGRVAQALSVYRSLRDNLVNDAGIEPSSRLRDIQRGILVESPALQWQPSRGAGLSPALLAAG
jgi:DNA-binding SARP family transcriptional activator